MLPLRGVWLFAALSAVLASDRGEASGARATFLFFWGVGCPHCAEAMPFVAQLEREHDDLRFESWEVRKDPRGRQRFIDEVRRLGITEPSIPTFVCGDGYVAGFLKGASEPALRDLARHC